MMIRSVMIMLLLLLLSTQELPSDDGVDENDDIYYVHDSHDC